MMLLLSTSLKRQREIQFRVAFVILLLDLLWKAYVLDHTTDGPRIYQWYIYLMHSDATWLKHSFIIIGWTIVLL